MLPILRDKYLVFGIFYRVMQRRFVRFGIFYAVNGFQRRSGHASSADVRFRWYMVGGYRRRILYGGNIYIAVCIK